MKKVLITALSLVLVGSVLLSAAGPKSPKGEECECVKIEGVIVGISEDSLTIDDGSEIIVTEDTVITEKGKPLAVNLLEVGDLVKICAQDDDGVLVACKINVKGVCVCVQ